MMECSECGRTLDDDSWINITFNDVDRDGYDGSWDSDFCSMDCVWLHTWELVCTNEVREMLQTMTSEGGSLSSEQTVPLAELHVPMSPAQDRR